MSEYNEDALYKRPIESSDPGGFSIAREKAKMKALVDAENKRVQDEQEQLQKDYLDAQELTEEINTNEQPS